MKIAVLNKAEAIDSNPNTTPNNPKSEIGTTKKPITGTATKLAAGEIIGTC